MVKIKHYLPLNINFDLAMRSNSKYAFFSFIYLLSWMLFIIIGLRNYDKSIIIFSYIFWGITLITSLFIIISNILPNFSDIFSPIFIIFVFAFATPLKGFAFSNNPIVIYSVFSIISTLIISIPYLYKLIIT